MKPFHLLLLPLIFCFSCKGQVSTGMPANGLQKEAKAGVQPKMIKLQGSDAYQNVHCGLQDKAGNLWFGTTAEGLYCYNGKSFTNFTKKDGLSSNCIYAILEDKAGHIWLGTSAGICRYDGKTISSLVAPGATGPTKEVFSIFQDKAGDFWFGTVSGVFRYNGKSFTSFCNDSVIRKSGLRLNVIQSIVEDKAGNMWFASWEREGVCRYNGISINGFTPNGDDMVYSILEDRSGNIWFGTRDHGACLYNPATGIFTDFSAAKSFSKGSVYAMAEDPKGNIWFGTNDNGLWCYDGMTFKNFTTEDGLVNNSIFSITIDRSGILWLGSRGTGLCSYDGKTFTGFSD